MRPRSPSTICKSSYMSNQRPDQDGRGRRQRPPGRLRPQERTRRLAARARASTATRRSPPSSRPSRSSSSSTTSRRRRWPSSAAASTRRSRSSPNTCRPRPALDDAERNLRNTKVLAPIDGVATQVAADPARPRRAGRAAGVRGRRRQGPLGRRQPEGIGHDLCPRGPARDRHASTPSRAGTGRARSARSRPGTGAQFSILPPQNASGNWVKVVQRVPLRFCFDPDEDTSNLRAGHERLSVDRHRPGAHARRACSTASPIRSTA